MTITQWRNAQMTWNFSFSRLLFFSESYFFKKTRDWLDSGKSLTSTNQIHHVLFVILCKCGADGRWCVAQESEGRPELSGKAFKFCANFCRIDRIEGRLAWLWRCTNNPRLSGFKVMNLWPIYRPQNPRIAQSCQRSHWPDHSWLPEAFIDL